MSQDGSPFGDFEARLAALKTKMVAGLPERAREFREAALALEHGAPEALVGARRLAHRLAGIAGSHGFHRLTEQGRAAEHIIDEDASVEQIRAAMEALATACDAVAADPEAHTGATPPLPESRAKERRRVLAIEDDAATAQLLTLTLSRIGGFEATVVDSGEKALAVIEAERFDLILVDAMMPGMNGLQLCQRLRSGFPNYDDVPVVVLSAASPADLGWDLEAEGLHPPDGWLRKPIRAKSLILDLEPFLRRALDR